MALCGGKHAHPMVLADPQVVYRKYGGAWRCDGCGCTDSARVLVFHCAQCNYDLCSACFCFLEARHPAHPHPFRLACQRSPTAATAPRCSECRAPLACAQVCTVCRNPPYRVCPACFNGFFVDGHEHRVVLAECDETYPEHHGRWHCDGCGKSGRGVSQMFHCPQCGDFDLCSECAFSSIKSPATEEGDDDDDGADDDDDDDDALHAA